MCIRDRFTPDDVKILHALLKEFSDCEWSAKAITAAIPRSIESIGVPHKWMAYKVAYLSLMGIEKGPRLAPILVEINQEDIIGLLQASLDALGE